MLIGKQITGCHLLVQKKGFVLTVATYKDGKGFMLVGREACEVTVLDEHGISSQRPIPDSKPRKPRTKKMRAGA
jgi:hypothetical protein